MAGSNTSLQANNEVVSHKWLDLMRRYWVRCVLRVVWMVCIQRQRIRMAKSSMTRANMAEEQCMSRIKTHLYEMIMKSRFKGKWISFQEDLDHMREREWKKENKQKSINKAKIVMNKQFHETWEKILKQEDEQKENDMRRFVEQEDEQKENDMRRFVEQ
eukprot:838700_1